MRKSYKHFLAIAASVAALCVVLFVGCNLWLDPFGLYRNNLQRTLPIVTSERTSKYLFSLRYVPDKYDAVLVGPSLSDHLDTGAISGYRMYNLSLQGANIREMRLLAGNVMRRGHLKLLLICLDPYILRNLLIQDERMQPQMEWAALGSSFMIQYYWDRIAMQLKGRDRFSGYGLHGNLAISYAPQGAEWAIRNFVQALGAMDAQPHEYDRVALDELKGLIDEAHRYHVRVVGFHFPVPFAVRTAMHERYTRFQAAVAPYFSGNDTLLDFTGNKYRAFAQDYRNFSDQGHLSHAGAAFLAHELDAALR